MRTALYSAIIGVLQSVENIFGSRETIGQVASFAVLIRRLIVIIPPDIIYCFGQKVQVVYGLREQEAVPSCVVQRRHQLIHLAVASIQEMSKSLQANPQNVILVSWSAITGYIDSQWDDETLSGGKGPR